MNLVKRIPKGKFDYSESQKVQQIWLSLDSGKWKTFWPNKQTSQINMQSRTTTNFKKKKKKDFNHNQPEVIGQKQNGKRKIWVLNLK